MVAIVEFRTGLVVDQFWSLDTSISPDGRYIASTFMYPLHGEGAEKASDVYSIYDLARSPKANRAAVGVLADVRAGFPIYPVENANRGTYTSLNAGATDTHRMARGFEWSAGPILQFVDEYKGSKRLISVDLREGLSDASVWYRTLRR